VKIPSSPPKQRRDEVKGKANGKGGGLVGNQIFYDATGQAFALIKDPGDPAKLADLLADLGATDALALVDADEKDAGVQP
jgi:hypothetical protein